MTLLFNFIMHVIFEHNDLSLQKLLVQCPCCHDSVITILLSTISKYLLPKVLITLFGWLYSSDKSFFRLPGRILWSSNHWIMNMRFLQMCEAYYRLSISILAFCTVWLVFLVFLFCPSINFLECAHWAWVKYLKSWINQKTILC